jgi:hypothetical protein
MTIYTPFTQTFSDPASEGTSRKQESSGHDFNRAEMIISEALSRSHKASGHDFSRAEQIAN